MSPEQLKMMQQQMANMDPATLQRMAAQMGGAPGVDMAAAARQMQNMSSDDLLKAQSEMKNMKAGDLEARAKQVSDQMKYARDCASRAKAEGNQLVKAGSYEQAIDKYSRAADALQADTTTEGQVLVKACRLNVVHCLLKLERWGEAEEECDEVICGDPNNLKALFRRGQARLELAQKAGALEDLQAAASICPASDPSMINIQDAIKRAQSLPDGFVASESKQMQDRDFWEARSTSELRKELSRRGVDYSQCTEKAELVELVCSGARGAKKQDKVRKSQTGADVKPKMNVTEEQLDQVKRQMEQNPDSMKQAAARMANMSDEEIQRMSEMTGQKFDPAMAKMAASMMQNMTPEQMTQQLEMAKQMQQGSSGGVDPSAAATAMQNATPEQLEQMNAKLAASGMDQKMTPEMASMAGEMMKNMSPEDMKAMMEMSQSMQKGGTPSMADAAKMSELMSKNPEMLKSMGKAMKNMDPEQLTKMGISAEQAKTLSESVESMDPRTLESLVKWSGRIQKVASPFITGYQKVRSIDRQAVLHILILIFAALFVGHLTNSF